MSKKKKVVLISVVLIIAAVVAFFIYKYVAKSKSQKTEIKKEKVIKDDITRVVEETGIVKSQVGAQVKVGTRATGTLMKLRFQVGDKVKKGDLIAVIDDRQILADMDNAKANLVYAESNYNLVKSSYPLKIAEQDSQVKSIKAQLDYASTTLKREQELLKRNFATQDEVEKAKKEADVYAANLQQAQTTLERLKDEYSKQVSLAQSSADQSKARLKNLEVSLTYTRIFSPSGGIVSQVSTQEGEMVVSGLSTTNLITIIDPTRLEIWIYVDETDIGKVKEGMEVEYRVDAFRERKFKGTIGSIYPQPEVKENVVYYLAIVRVDPKDAEVLRTEMTTHVKVISEIKKGVLLVPNMAVKFEKGDYVVLVPKGGKNTPVIVKIGVRDEKNTEIVSGLKEGDEIVIETPAGGPKNAAAPQNAPASQKKP
jgi:multidrug efflux pump subunit AcrA (membrane-fusion protein)